MTSGLQLLPFMAFDCFLRNLDPLGQGMAMLTYLSVVYLMNASHKSNPYTVSFKDLRL